MSIIAEYIRRLSERDNIFIKWAIIIVFTILVASLFPTGESIESDYPVGSVWTSRELIASFSFPIYKDEITYQRERQAAAGTVYHVFEEDYGVSKRSIDSLQRFFIELEKILNTRASYEHKRDQYQKGKTVSLVDLIADSAALVSLRNFFPISFTESEWKTLQLLYAADQTTGTGSRIAFRRLQRDVLLVVNELYLQGILDVRKSSLAGVTSIAYRKKTDERIVALNRFLDQEDLGRKVQELFLSGYRKENDTLSVAMKISLSFLAPNLLYQKAQTEKEIAIAMDLVPRTLGVVQQNERIIGKGERITEDSRLKLSSLKKAKGERGGEINRWSTFLGKFLHIFAIVWLFVFYLYLFRKKIFHDNSRLLLLALIIFIEAFVAYLTLILNVNAPIEFLIVAPTASMLFAIIFDSRVAFYGTVVTSLIIAGVRGNEYSMMLHSIIAGSIALYTVRDIKHRTQIFRSISFVFLGYLVSILALSLERYETLPVITDQIVFAAINAIVSPVLTYASLIVFERFFHVTTDLTLLEFSDLNHPLLQELSHKAPGTFHHSVNLATLAESAAEAVDANPILARVGAYFHDIGKLGRPSAYVENQLTSSGKMEKMSPLTHARLIASHVKEGIELAGQKRLPDTVIDFIPMHHGTTQIGFFYTQALKRRNKTEELNPNDFRYPGPKPQTKETGIVMLADAVEAATRAIEEPTVQKIEERVDAMIKARFMEGELDECDLTLRDLSKIRSSFVKILSGIHHARLQYPEQPSISSPAPEVSEQTIAAPAGEPATNGKRTRRRIRNIDAS